MPQLSLRVGLLYSAIQSKHCSAATLNLRKSKKMKLEGTAATSERHEPSKACKCAHVCMRGRIRYKLLAMQFIGFLFEQKKKTVKEYKKNSSVSGEQQK